jgi:hypothetical protein
MIARFLAIVNTAIFNLNKTNVAAPGGQIRIDCSGVKLRMAEFTQEKIALSQATSMIELSRPDERKLEMDQVSNDDRPQN